MTPAQTLNEIQKELAINERLAGLLKDFGKHLADVELRANYKTNEAAVIIRQTGMAEGVEKFVDHITKVPTAARPSDRT